MIYNGDHFYIYGWMRTALRLSGVELLLYAVIYDKKQITVREASEWLGMTERYAIKILDKLAQAGLTQKAKIGRENVYVLTKNEPHSELEFRVTQKLREKEAKREDTKEDYLISNSLIKENEDRDNDIDCTSNNTKDIKSKGIDNKSANDIQKEKTNRFIPPTVEQVREYCETRNNDIDAEHFVDFYASKGWMIGKNKMKDWKAAVRTWENKRKEKERQEQKEYEATHYSELDDIF